MDIETIHTLKLKYPYFIREHGADWRKANMWCYTHYIEYDVRQYLNQILFMFKYANDAIWFWLIWGTDYSEYRI